ncbi:hypothetical protein Poly21_07130 [Allorhodopirellula heiligendammensis]|uniref:Uncharacterized protein n=2 Tax=Allorhodopirellula heiligendammensis TaxID=2714739 RepID=A0A5C6C6Z4_9BACT|nr:hypothetical protein Poly21_07130 [Allorhodopirellula heiligendammensis]
MDWSGDNFCFDFNELDLRLENTPFANRLNGRTADSFTKCMPETTINKLLIRRNLRLLGAVTLIAFACMFLSTAGPFRSVYGHGVSAEEANARLWHCHLPMDAKNVWFESGYRMTRVECELGQDAFRSWCDSVDWKPIVIVDDVPEWVFSMRIKSWVEVRRGLEFSNRDGDVGYRATFDADTQTAYAVYSGG